MSVLHFLVLAAVQLTLTGSDVALDQSSVTDQQTWASLILQVGPETAYSEMAERIKYLSDNEQHIVAHQFGKALYEEIGLEGLVVCDNRFLYGCIHEFTAQSILNGGFGVLQTLDEACIKLQSAPSFCQHGMGHGIVSYLGYRFEDLEEALELCDSLTKIVEHGGCKGGVFMEYNLRQILGPGSVRESDDLGDPCNRLDQRYQVTCTFWLPQWWKSGPLAGIESNPEAARKIGELCAQETSTEDVLRACVRGAGVIISTAGNFNPADSITLCGHLADNNTEHFTLCIQEAAGYMASNNQPKSAETLCIALEKNQQDKCLTYIESKL